MTYKIEFLRKDVPEIKAILDIFLDLKIGDIDDYCHWVDSYTLQIADNQDKDQIFEDLQVLIDILSDKKIEYSVFAPCDACDGEGTYDVFNCVDSSNECCGGCFDQYQCEICEGDGQEMISSNLSTSKN